MTPKMWPKQADFKLLDNKINLWEVKFVTGQQHFGFGSLISEESKWGWTLGNELK